MFRCPRCAVPMGRERVAAGISWRCGSCRGRTATVGMLRKAVAKDVVNALWQEARRAPASEGVRCPACRLPMHEARLAVGPGVQAIDFCTRCQFAWFDPGEYRDLTDYAPSAAEVEAHTPERRLAPEAAEALAQFQLEHAREMAAHRDVGGMTGGEPPDAWWKWLPALLGMPVEFDAVPVARRPWVTYALVAVVSLVSVLAFGSLESAVRAFGFVPDEPLRKGGITVLSSFFLHGGWMHLIGNMYFLVVFGDNVEDFLGHRRMLLLVLLATIAGDVLHALLTSTPGLPCVGASGGISGVIAYYAFKFPRVRLGFLWYYVSWVRIPAVAAFVLWVALQVWGVTTAGSGVAHGAHLGGAIVGLAFCGLAARDGGSGSRGSRALRGPRGR